MNSRFDLIMKSIIYVMLFIVLFPFLILFIWSFTEIWSWPGILPQSFSLRAFMEIFGGSFGIIKVLLSSILISLLVSIFSITVSIPAARAIVLYDFFGKDLLKFAVLMPIIIPTAAFAMGIHIIFIRIDLNDTVLGVVLVHTILCLPYTVRILTEVTEASGNKLEVQARVLGASPLQVFTNITLPNIIPGIISAGSLAFIVSFSQYFITFLIGGGSVVTLSMVMFPYIQSGDRAIASAYSILFVLSTLFVFILFEKTIRKYYDINDVYFFN